MSGRTCRQTSRRWRRRYLIKIRRHHHSSMYKWQPINAAAAAPGGSISSLLFASRLIISLRCTGNGSSRTCSRFLLYVRVQCVHQVWDRCRWFPSFIAFRFPRLFEVIKTYRRLDLTTSTRSGRKIGWFQRKIPVMFSNHTPLMIQRRRLPCDFRTWKYLRRRQVNGMKTLFVSLIV